ncbi:GcrA family cell cycle regulator [Beijerinckia indica]|uniref:GcrA cell cycle regulator n=1 Tax=Beijerinckia indica subsp. indica (strain ATCC 9039 / DSM 1715 / NCIMB 8712) TaxID=395963 RepID=B2IGX3_BEII9|nr:GcrA family cell cycle regulator [Beijerinckia indica]ACB97219.1 GcrA cell cycle regulator [Beijerinckia indica subsp. indica ATCC 9039]
MSWTDERVELLRKLWLEGLSASQIAAELADGLTRNAVIGKVHRLGLSGRTKGAATAEDEEPVQEPEIAQETQHSTQKIEACAAPVMPMVVGNTVLAVAIEDAPVEAQAPVPEPLPKMDVVVPLSERVTILELRESTCRWPIGDPTQPDFRFCGAHKAPGTGPYCTYHSRIAYQPQQDRRRIAKMQQKSA